MIQSYLDKILIQEKEAREIKAYVSIKDGEINDYELSQSNINHSFSYANEDQTYFLVEPDDQISNSRYINADVINVILLCEGKKPALEDHIKNFIQMTGIIFKLDIFQMKCINPLLFMINIVHYISSRLSETMGNDLPIVFFFYIL